MVNSHGHHLLTFCKTVGFSLATGRAPGDLAAFLTFRARSNTLPSRIDHVLPSCHNVSTILSSHVNSSRFDSDHFPLETYMSLPCIVGDLPPPDGLQLSAVRWVAGLRSTYVHALGPFALHGDEPDQLAASFLSQLESVACSAGMHRHPVAGLRLPGRARRHEPYFDAECRRLKAGQCSKASECLSGAD